VEDKITAIIFDMDGVISDTQKLHSKVEQEILSRFGINISSEEITKKYSGVKTSEFFDELLKNQPQPYNLNELMEEKWKRMAELGEKSVEEIDGATELICRLYDAGFKMAVASASNQAYVKSVIQSLNLEKYFKFLASGDMVSKGKPNPEIFLLAASRLEANPENCLVIEDGMSGMQAAKIGKMKCIGLVKLKNNQYPTKNLVLSLKEITLEYLSSLS
jgi:HAD superfamily hydrolase (TIGR01549 family)